MQKLIFIFAFCCFLVSSSKGQVFKTNEGRTTFFSEAALENIEAVSSKSQAALNLSASQVAVKIAITTFQFANSLMQTHFNENYMESASYPYATLTGTLDKGVQLDVQTLQSFQLTAKVEMHGVAKNYTIPVSIKAIDANTLQVLGEFRVRLADHNIEIPQLMYQKIAEEVRVTFYAILKKG